MRLLLTDAIVGHDRSDVVILGPHLSRPAKQGQESLAKFEFHLKRVFN